MKICIIGGGHSGWWTAAYLEKNVKDIDITLYETDLIPVIGVGESCLPQIKRFYDGLELTPEIWMGTTATIKWGNNHVEWDKEGGEDFPIRFWYDEENNFDKWDFKSDFNNDHIQNDEEWNDHAYHIDTYENTRIVKESTKNVRVKNEKLTSLPNGFDFYVDCTGFSSFFTKDKTRLEISKHHILDSAWVCPVKRDDYDTTLTNSIVRNCGWQFEVPLTDRLGTGYIFSSKFIDDNQALEEYQEMIKNDYKLAEPRKINWDPKVLKNPWTDNIVSIGTSAGFVDPLEATSLYMVQIGIIQFAKCLNRNYSSKTYNRIMNNIWRDCLDYIVAEYVLCGRRHTDFWKSFDESQDFYSKLMWKYYKTRSSSEKYIFPSGVWAQLGYYYNDFKYYGAR